MEHMKNPESMNSGRWRKALEKVKYEEVCRQRYGILTCVTMSPKQYFPAVFSNIRSNAARIIHTNHNMENVLRNL
jgi:hypothetical protein